MKIIDEGDIKYFIINGDEKLLVSTGNDGSIEIFEEADPIHTGHYFQTIQDFYYFINGLSEIAKKIKEE